MAKQVKPKVKPMQEVDRTERLGKGEKRPTYTLIIKNNVTGKVEMKEEILSIVGALKHAHDHQKCGHSECNSASLVWGVTNGEEVKEALVDLAMTQHQLIQRTEASHAARGLAAALAGMFGGKKPEAKKAK